MSDTPDMVPGDEVQKRAFDGRLRFSPDRTFWQFMFPLDGVEERVIRKGGKSETVKLTYDRAYLVGQLEANFKTRQRFQSQHGAPPQPLPVSIQHAIEERVYEGVDHELSDLRRWGNVLDLYFSEGSDEHPAGLWALVEWTPEGLEKVDAGTWNMLSPTTLRDLRVTSGDVIEGDSFIAIGVVDMPALDSIGSARDRLPWDAFASKVAVANDESVPDARKGALRGRQFVGSVISRRALHIAYRGDERATEGPMSDDPTKRQDEEEEAAEAIEAEATPEDDGDAETRNPVAEAVAELISAIKEPMEAMALRLEEQIRGALEARAAEPAEAPEAADDAEPAEEAPAVDASEIVQRAANEAHRDSLTAVARKASEEATDLASRGKLLAGNVADYVQRRIDGKDVSDLVGDFWGLSQPSGSVGSQPDGAAAATGPSRTGAQLRAEAEKRAGDNATDKRIVLRHMQTIHDEWEAAGLTITD